MNRLALACVTVVKQIVADVVLVVVVAFHGVELTVAVVHERLTHTGDDGEGVDEHDDGCGAAVVAKVDVDGKQFSMAVDGGHLQLQDSDGQDVIYMQKRKCIECIIHV